MRKSLAACVIFASVFSASLISAAQISAAQSGKVESIGPATDSNIPEAVRKVLDAKGYRVTLDDSSASCEIWLRKSVPSQKKRDIPSEIYSQLPESTLVGVISFLQATTDYRGQAIKAGAYTLRYELIPNDGNHLGVAPNRDFLLLVSAASDTDPDAVFKFDEVVNLSRKATGTRHPGPLSLVPAEGGTAPTVSKGEEEHWVFSAVMKLASGEDLPFALVVKGTAPQ